MNKMKLRRIALLVALAAFGSIAVASEGQAGGGTPITTCAEVVTTNAFLINDLYCPGTDGIVVGASGITIDLKGFVLRGDRAPDHWGIADDPGHDNVTVKNGVVRTFEQGIVEVGGDGFSVSKVVVSGNRFDGVYVVGEAASISSSTSSGNGLSGVYVGGASAKIQSSIFSGNDAHGVFVDGASASIKSSTTSGNGAYGITVKGDAAQIKGNRADANGFLAGSASDLSGAGIDAYDYMILPVGTNVAHGNDDPAECSPASLC